MDGSSVHTSMDVQQRTASWLHVYIHGLLVTTTQQPATSIPVSSWSSRACHIR